MPFLPFADFTCETTNPGALRGILRASLPMLAPKRWLWPSDGSQKPAPKLWVAVDAEGEIGRVCQRPPSYTATRIGRIYERSAELSRHQWYLELCSLRADKPRYGDDSRYASEDIPVDYDVLIERIYQVLCGVTLRKFTRCCGSVGPYGSVDEDCVQMGYRVDKLLFGDEITFSLCHVYLPK